MLKNHPTAHQFEADLVFISSDKVSPLPWAVQQPLYHMVYEISVCTARPSCSCWVYYFGHFPGKINCFATVFILTSPQITAISNHSPSLQHFPGQWTVCSHTILERWGGGSADAQLVSLRRVRYLLPLRNPRRARPPSLLPPAGPAHHTAHTNLWLETLLQKLDNKASSHKID